MPKPKLKGGKKGTGAAAVLNTADRGAFGGVPTSVTRALAVVHRLSAGCRAICKYHRGKVALKMTDLKESRR